MTDIEIKYTFNLSSSILNNDIKYILILLNLFIIFDFFVIRVNINIPLTLHLIIYYHYRSEIYILSINRYTRLIRVTHIIVVVFYQLVEILRLSADVTIAIHVI